MKRDKDDIREKKELYEYFSPMVMKTLKFLRKLLFYEIRRKYIITPKSVYPDVEHWIGEWKLKRKGGEKSSNGDGITVVLALDPDLLSVVSGLHFYVKVSREIKIKSYWSYSKVASHIWKTDGFKEINRILLSLVLNIYIDNNLFSENKKDYGSPDSIMRCH
ncbi:hypothetical protein MUP35_00300 [Patescibacteria group bacterium]|nr:hypothetical protein [Patescibacteria group bacterium]